MEETESYENTAEQDDSEPQKQAVDQTQEVKKWLDKINVRKNAPLRKKFIKEGKQAIRKYRNESATSSDYNPRTADTSASRYNVTWSSIQTMKPSFYSRLPKPVVVRLHKNKNPVKRLAATIAERCASFALKQEEDTFNQVLEAIVEDRLLPGLGAARQVFESDISKAIDPNTGAEVDVVSNEKAQTRYIYWQDIIYSHGRIWTTDVDWIAIRHQLSKSEIKKQFDNAEEGFYPSREIRCNVGDPSADRVLPDDDSKEQAKKAEVWEVWCKETLKVYFVSDGLKDKFLKVQDDPLKLDSFFPFPRPLMSTCTTDDLIPVCDYRIVKGLVEDLDFTFTRISELMDSVRFVGLHDASITKEMIQMRNLKDGTTLPVKAWANFAEKGGIKGCIDFFPIERVIQVIAQLAEYGQGLLAQYYEVTGIPDIIRGSSAPSESATAQQFKGQFATIRIADKQADVQRFCKDLIAIKAEIIFELFTDETIKQMADFDDMNPEEQELFPAALAVLRNDRAREFAIDVETDSTLALDENSEKAARLEYLSSLGQFFQNALGMMQALPESTELAFESIKFGVGAFRQGRELEGLVDSTIQQVKDKIAADKEAQAQAAEQAANQPPPRDPAEIKAEADMMIAQFRAQLEQQTMAQKAEIEQAKIGIEQQKAIAKAETERALADQKMAIEQMKAQQDVFLKRYKTEADIQLEAEKIRNDLMKMVAGAGDSEQVRMLQDLGLAKKPVSRKRVRVIKDEAGEPIGMESEELS